MPKKILVLYGDNIEIENIRTYFNPIRSEDPGNKVEVLPIKNFLHPRFMPSAYDLIFINAHGSAHQQDASADGIYRAKHSIQAGPHQSIDTIEVIKKCADSTPTIIVESCHSGAVIKDLYREGFNKNVRVITLVGSKHTSILSLCSATFSLRLMQGVQDLTSLINTTLPDTVCVREQNGEIYKISAVRTLTKRASVTSQYKVEGNVYGDVLRYKCVPRRVIGEGAGEVNSWWRVADVISYVPNTAEFNNAALAIALEKKDLKGIRYWLDQGADSYAPVGINNISPMELAIWARYTQGVRAMLEYGANPNTIFVHRDSSPLLKAVFFELADIVALLLFHKADPNLARTLNNTGPLSVASQNGNTEIVRLLLIYGANPTPLPDLNNQTPLRQATLLGHIEIVALLLRFSMTASQHTVRDMSIVLQHAVCLGSTEIIRLLLERNARLNVISPMILTASLAFAAYKAHRASVELLLHYGANPNVANGVNIEAPLVQGAQIGDLAIVQLLLAHHADPSLANTSNGMTPLELATRCGHTEIRNLIAHQLQVQKYKASVENLIERISTLSLEDQPANANNTALPSSMVTYSSAKEKRQSDYGQGV